MKDKKPKKSKKSEKEKKQKKPRQVKAAAKPAPKREHFFEAVGRRKTSVARIRLFTRRGARDVSREGTLEPAEKLILVNEKPHNVYFPTLELQQIVQAALDKMKCLERFKIIAKVKGGGFHSQAEAIRHGIARALVLFNQDFKKRLKKAGYLTRDSRMRERKKFGLKRARRAPQWQKR